MDMTVDDIINELDLLIEAMSYHDERLLIPMETAQELRDELMRCTDEYDE